MILLADLLELFDDSTEFEISIQIRGLEFRTETITKKDLTYDIEMELYVNKLFPHNPVILCCYKSEKI